MTDMGKILNSHTVVFERVLPGPIERVWEHLTSPAGLATWLCPNASTDLMAGGRIDFKMANADPDTGNLCNIRGMVNQCEPPHVFDYSWFETTHDLTSTVRFALESQGDNVLLTLTHSRLAPDSMPKVGAGWHAHLDQLAAVLRGETAPDFWPIYNEMFKKYSAAIAATIIVASVASPAIASSDDPAYKALSDQRQVYVRTYDRVWKEADRIKDQIDVLKRDSSADTGRALDDLDRELKHKYQDLRQIELDIRDLDKVVEHR